MSSEGSTDYFVTDVDDDLDDDLLGAPVIVPAPATVGAPVTATETPAGAAADAAGEHVLPASSAPSPPSVAPEEAPVATPDAPPAPVGLGSGQSREEQLAAALDGLMAANPDIQAAALVSLDGFAMASALPEGMQEDRVGAMSAAILGLGERAAAELGRGALGQVYIEGDDGFVVLISAGGRSVLTALASSDARLGLVLYDMRSSAQQIGAILG